MDNKAIRQHLRQGELAVTLLESLGYTYKQPLNGKPEWVAPPVQERPETIAEKIAKEIQNVIDTQVTQRTEAAFALGPNPDITKSLVGKSFKVDESKIPGWHKGRRYDFGKTQFKVTKVEWRADEKFYAVHFEFARATEKFYQFGMGKVHQGVEKVAMWLPLGACRFVEPSNAQY